MAFRVEIAPRAFDAIRTLEVMPSRCPIADESEDVGQQIRVLLYGKRNRRYKVYYAIPESQPHTGTVRVFHVRHWARKRLLAGELRDLMDEASRET